jgi:hypothetical protein
MIFPSQMEPLDQVNICLNCRGDMPAKAMFCPSCGQQKVKRLISLRELITDLIASVFNLESKLWRTLAGMIVPGKLTESYFLGRRASLLTPFRIFFIVAVAHFTILALRIHGSARDTLERFILQQRDAVYDQRFTAHLDTLIDETKTDFPKASVALDTLLAKSRSGKSALLLNGSISLIGYKDGRLGNGKTITLEDMITLPRDALFEKYAIGDPFSRLQVQVIQRLAQNPDSFVQFLLSKLIWLAIFLVPALAVVLQLLYLRRKRYFVEHLVFSLHYHTLAFALMGLFFQFSFQHPEYFGWFLLLIFIYGFLAIKRFYGQGWRKTFVKFGILHFLYLLLVSLSQVAVFLLSAIAYGNS